MMEYSGTDGRLIELPVTQSNKSNTKQEGVEVHEVQGFTLFLCVLCIDCGFGRMADQILLLALAKRTFTKDSAKVAPGADVPAVCDASSQRRVRVTHRTNEIT